MSRQDMNSSEEQEAQQDADQGSEPEQPDAPQEPPAEDTTSKPKFYPSREKKAEGKSVAKGCLVALIALVGVAFLLMVSFTLVIFASVMGGMSGMGGPGTNVKVVDGITLTERTVSGEDGAKKIALMPVQGLLVRDEYGDPVRQLKAMLTMAEKDPKVAAVILEVNSGGGSVYASDLLYKAVADWRARTERPVVVLMGGVAASGAYYLSCAADEIVAQRTTMTGSIGVLLPLYDVTGLMDKIGVQDKSVSSGPRKDMLSPTSQRSQEEMARLEELVESMHNLFVEVVAEGRDMDVEEVRPLANGDIYTADEAVQNGLIDHVGYVETATQRAKSLAGLAKSTTPHVVRYGRYMSFVDMLLTRVESPGLKVELTDAMSARMENKPLYLWSPATDRNVVTSN